MSTLKQPATLNHPSTIALLPTPPLSSPLIILMHSFSPPCIPVPSSSLPLQSPTQLITSQTSRVPPCLLPRIFTPSSNVVSFRQYKRLHLQLITRQLHLSSPLQHQVYQPLSTSLGPLKPSGIPLERFLTHPPTTRLPWPYVVRSLQTTFPAALVLCLLQRWLS